MAPTPDDALIAKLATRLTFKNVELSNAQKEKWADILALNDKGREQLAKILHKRGVTADIFMRWAEPGEWDAIPPEGELKNDPEALQLIADAISNDEQIGVYGDYDADGNTSLAQWVTYLQAINATPPIDYKKHTRINTRKEGYGMTPEKVEELYNAGVRVLITVDMGTHEKACIEKARKLGMKVVVFDHHNVGDHNDVQWDAETILVNPQQEGDTSGQQAACGASLSYREIYNLDKILKKQGKGSAGQSEKVFDELAAIAATGVVADVVPLNHPLNRHVVQRGLKALNNGKNIGIKLLAEYLGIGTLSSGDLGFVIGPILNAASRMGDPDLGARLLVKQSELNQAVSEEEKARIIAEADQVAREGITKNEMRKRLSNGIYYPQAVEKAQAFIEKRLNRPLEIKEGESREDALARVLREEIGVLVIDFPPMEADIRGILASMLKERFGVPVLAFEQQAEAAETRYKLSGRSVEGVALDKSLVEALKAQDLKPDWLLGIGGHAMACGGSIIGNETALQELTDFAVEQLGTQAIEAIKDHKPTWDIEMSVEEFREKGPALLRAFRVLEPIGKDNPAPRVKLTGARVTGLKEMADGLHRSVTLSPANDDSSEAALEGGVVFFNDGSPFQRYIQNGLAEVTKPYYHTQADMIVEPSLRTRNGRDEISYEIKYVDNIKAAPPLQTLTTERKARKVNAPPTPSPPPPTKYLLKDFLNNPTEPNVQQALARMAEDKLAAYDLETTGLNIASINPRETNAITQIAAVKSVWNGDHYIPQIFDRFTTPENPLFFEYEWMEQQGQEVPPYRPTKYEYPPSPKALGVTGARFERDTPRGKVAGMTIKKQRIDNPAPKPFYAAAKDYLRFVVDSKAIGYNNASFDNPGFLNHFWNTLAPLVASNEYPALASQLEAMDMTIPPNVRNTPYKFQHPEALKAYAEAIGIDEILQTLQQRKEMMNADPRMQELEKIRQQLAAMWENKLALSANDAAVLHARETELQRQINDFPFPQNLSPLDDFENPARYIDSMRHTLWMSGDGPSRRITDASVLSGLVFERDDSKHDAAEDILPIIAMINEFALKAGERQRPSEYYENLKHGIRNLDPKSIAGLWELMLQEFDPQAKVEIQPDEIDHYKRDAKGGKKGEISDIISGKIRITFSEQALKNPDARKMAGFLRSLGQLNTQNRNITEKGLDVSNQDDGSIILRSKSSYERRKIKHFGVLNKALAARDLIRSKQIDKIQFFDSSAQVDIWLTGSDTPIESAPLQSLRKSLPFLTADNQREHFADNLELLKLVDKLKFSSLAILDQQDGTPSLTLRGVQRGFGEVRIVTDKPTPALYRAYLEKYSPFLSSLANAPGTEQSSYSLIDGAEEGTEEEQDELQGEEVLQQAGVQRVILLADRPEFKYVIPKALYESVARYQEWPIHPDLPKGKKKLFTLGSGIAGKYDKETGNYTLEGPLHQFGEIHTPILNMAYFLRRLDTLPGVSRVQREGDVVHLNFDPAVDRDTMWILYNSHIPFTAVQERALINGKDQPQGRITIRLDDKATNLFHYNRDLKRHRQKWSRLQETDSHHDDLAMLEAAIANDTPLDDLHFKKLPPQDVSALCGLIPLHDHLLEENLHTLTVDRLGKGTVTAHNGTPHRILPQEDGRVKLVFNSQTQEIKPKDSTILQPDLLVSPNEKLYDVKDVVKKRLALQLSQLSKLRGLYASKICVGELPSRGEEKPYQITLQFPQPSPYQSTSFIQEKHALDILPQKEALMLRQEFEKVANLTRSRHLSGLAETLQHIKKKDDIMQALHQENQDSVKTKTAVIKTELTQHKKNFLALIDELHSMADKEIYLHYREVLFKNINAITTVREAVEKLQKQSQPHHADYRQRQVFLKQDVPLFEQLNLADFKRFTIALDSAEMLKEMLPMLGMYARTASDEEKAILAEKVEKIDKVLRDYDSGTATLAKAIEKTTKPEFKTDYDEHRYYANLVEKLQKSSSTLRSSLHLGNQEITRAATTLLHEDSLKPLRAMASHVEEQALFEAQKHLHQLERAGLVSGVEIDKETRTVTFDAPALLKPKPELDVQEEAKRHLDALHRGELGPPFMLLDTSTLITLLTMLPDVEGTKDAGYLHLLTAMTKAKQIEPVITSAVLSEFLDATIPLALTNIFILDGNGKVKGLRDDTLETLKQSQLRKTGGRLYPKYSERIEWLKDMVNTGARFVETEIDAGYLDAIRLHPNAEIRKELEAAWAKIAPDSPLAKTDNATLKAHLLKNTKERHDFITLLRAHKIHKHLGDRSLASAADQLQREYGHTVPLLMSCDSSDVPFEVNRTYHRSDNSYSVEETLSNEQKHKLDPEHKKYDHSRHAELGNLSYFSAASLLKSLNTQFQKAKKPIGVFAFQEPQNPESFKEKLEDAFRCSGMQTKATYGRFQRELDIRAGASGLQAQENPTQSWLEKIPPEALNQVMSAHGQKMFEYHKIAKTMNEKAASGIVERTGSIAPVIIKSKPFTGEEIYETLKLLKESNFFLEEDIPQQCLEIFQKDFGSHLGRMRLIVNHPQFTELFPQPEIGQEILRLASASKSAQHQQR